MIKQNVAGDRLDIFGGIQHHGFQQLYLFYLAKCQAGEGIRNYLWIFIMVINGNQWYPLVN